MTVQYGEDTATSSGYGDLHPVLQKHLDDLHDTVQNATTPYGAAPFNPAPQPPQPQMAASPEHIPDGAIPTTQVSGAPASQQAGQLPNQTAMQGVQAGGSADSPAETPSGTNQPKPGSIQMPGAAPGPPPPIDTSDIDNMNQQANADNQYVTQAYATRLGQAGTSGSMGQQGGNGPTTGFQLSPNMNVPGLDNEQVGNARAIIQAGLQRGMSRQDITAAIMAGLTESSLRNLAGGDRDSAGLFQMRPSQGWGSYQQVTDPNYEIGKFYDEMSGLQGRQSMTPWAEDQAIERSAFADGSNYYRNYELAQRAVDQLTQQAPQGFASSPTVNPNGSLQWISQNTNKYLDFDGYYGAQCVDLYDFYCTGFVGASPNPVGYADEIWYNHDTRAFTQIDSAQIPHMGDVAVWGSGPYTPMSHVGIIIKDNGDGTVQTLSNNATSAGPSGNSAVVNISKQALLGYLRPNKLI